MQVGGAGMVGVAGTVGGAGTVGDAGMVGAAGMVGVGKMGVSTAEVGWGCLCLRSPAVRDGTGTVERCFDNCGLGRHLCRDRVEFDDELETHSLLAEL